MTNFESSKRRLALSAIALFVCIIMLLGATYAWFTDSAISPDNQITTGNLDVQLYHWTNDNAGTDISDGNTVLFPNTIIWEPGMTQVVYVSVKNAGTLNLKYKLDIAITGITEGTNYNLADVMEYSIVSGTAADPYGYVTEWTEGNKFENAPGTNATDVVDVVLAPGAEDFYAIAIHMLESAGNEYMNKAIAFDINVLAGQAAVESDSFGTNYDKYAGYAGKAFLPKPVAGQTAVTETITNKAGTKIGTIVIPAGAVDTDPEKNIEVTVDDSSYKANITVDTGLETKAVEVKVDGLKANNDVAVKVQLRIDAGLDPATVKLYHYDSLIDSSYNPSTGYVTFESTSFSPFTIVYDAESVYVAPEVPKDEGGAVLYPTANVTYKSEYVGADADIEWGEYGQWSPTAGLEANLEAAFLFACPEELDEAFAEWYCDFYVSLDKALGANQLFLGGNYGSFGWVGFHNGELTLEANTEIGLLESVTTNPWTYRDVYDFVNEFTCGVGDVNDALDGATFTVKLRLTNPQNSAEFYDVNVVTYTFGGAYEIK